MDPPQQKVEQYHELKARVMCSQSICGLWRLSHGSPKMIGVSSARFVTKKRQCSLWLPIDTGKITYSVIVSATLPFARRRDRGRGVGEGSSPCDVTISRLMNALPEHPLSTRPFTVIGALRLGKMVVWTNSDLLSMDLSRRGPDSLRTCRIQ